MNSSNRRILLGAIFIILGGLFFLDNFGFFWFDFHHMIFSWHTIFLVIGIVILINHKNSLLGYIFLIIGLFGTLRHFVPFFFSLDFGDLWPIILFVIGLWLVLKRQEDVRINHAKINFESPRPQTSTYNQEIIDETCIFNSCKRIINTGNFKGGAITTIFGSVKLDLTNAKLAPGENTLEITTLFGGCDIRVPQNWKVLLNVTSVFGGFDDKRYAHIAVDQTGEGILVIKGVTIFGGGELLY